MGMPDSKRITQFSFIQLSGGIIIVRAQLDQFPDSLNFVLDTGSGGISLDSATVLQLGIPLTPSDKTIRGIAGVKTVSFAQDHQLKLPGLTIDHLDFHVNDYALLTSVYGVRIDGIMGYSFLRRYIVHINYDEQKIEVFTPGNYRYPKGGFLLRPQFTTLPLQQMVTTDAKTHLGRYIFDTGAGLCLLLSRDYVSDSGVFKAGRKFYTTQAEGLGGKKEMELSIIKQVKLGPFKFRNVPVHIFTDEYNITRYPTMGGIIGNDILRRFNVVLNYPDQSIHLKPNAHYNDAFDYSYTGLGIYLSNGEIKVVDVVADSPGEKAGFVPGDIIFGVQGNYSKNIQTYKNIFQNAVGKVKVIVFRDNVPYVLTLDVKDIRK